MRIELRLKNYRCFPDSSPARIVLEEGTWTAFLGANNAGKSTLLRFFYEFRPTFELLKRPEHWLNLANRAGAPVALAPSVRDPLEVFNNHNERPLAVEVRVSNPVAPGQDTAERTTGATLQVHRSDFGKWHLARLEQAGRPFGVEGSPPASLRGYTMTREPERMEVESLCRAMTLLAHTMYVGAFRHLLSTANPDYFDIHVGHGFVGRWRALKAGHSKRDSRLCGQVSTAIEGLFGYHRLEIDAAESGETFQIRIDQQVYRLDELGSGMAQFILVLANAAVRNPGYILIDEPELHLHPALQLDFLTALGGFARFGLLFSTHSVGLARAAADAVYAVRQVRPGVSQVVPYDAARNLPELLGALSYSGYQAIGFERVLLVEGTTEVRALQQFLRKLGKDHQVLLLPLGGASVIKADSGHELSELKRITTDLHCLIDSERASAAAPLARDREQFAETCQKLDIRCHVLERRALENYLTEDAIRRVKGDKYRALAPYEKLTDADPAWGKNENWRIAGAMSWDDVKDTDLGRFLAAL